MTDIDDFSPSFQDVITDSSSLKQVEKKLGHRLTRRQGKSHRRVLPKPKTGGRARKAETPSESSPVTRNSIGPCPSEDTWQTDYENEEVGHHSLPRSEGKIC